MTCSKREKGLNNKDFLKNLKVVHGTNTLYDKGIDEFAKKKWRIELIYKKILITYS